jgi:3-oxoacyl-[acyl-carrier protein] reductase
MIHFSLQHKQALVCGSTQGIGWAIAQAFADAGASCTLLARNEEALREKVQSLSHSQGQEHDYAVADFTDPDSLREVVAQLVTKKQYTILINNTGGPKAGMIAEADTIDFEKAFRQHIVGNQVLAQALLPGMKEAGYGRIINIISTSVRIPIDNLGVSNTIRAATASWAKTLSNEVGQYGITVNSILPGFIDTQRLRSLIEVNAGRKNSSMEQVAEEMKATIPAKRFGRTEEIAAVALFLASPAASYVNGVSMPVDGGKTGTI